MASDPNLIPVKLEYKVLGGETRYIEIEPWSPSVNISDEDMISIDLAPLSQCENLVSLSISSKILSELKLTPLSRCRRLVRLSITGGTFSRLSLAPLSKCKEFHELDLTSSRLARLSLTPLRKCPQFSKLNLSNNRLGTLNLSPLKSCKELTLLVLSGNLLSRLDLTPLSECANLEFLYLSNNRLTGLDLAPLRSCLNLQVLNLSDNQLSALDLTPLSSCQNLESLSLSKNRLTVLVLAPLMNSPNLELQLDGNQLTQLDLTPLVMIKGIDLRENPLRTLDVTPLFSMPLFSLLAIDDGVVLMAYRRFRWSRPPPGLQGLRTNIEWIERSTPAAAREVPDERRAETPATRTPEVDTTPRVVTGPVRRRASPEKFSCIKCGEPITTGGTLCSKCGGPQQRCMICRQFVGREELHFQCPHCKQLAHRIHLLDWLKTKDFCPYCRRKLHLTIG